MISVTILTWEVAVPIMTRQPRDQDKRWVTKIPTLPMLWMHLYQVDQQGFQSNGVRTITQVRVRVRVLTSRLLSYQVYHNSKESQSNGFHTPVRGTTTVQIGEQDAPTIKAIAKSKGIANRAIMENKGITMGAITENNGIANGALNHTPKESKGIANRVIMESKGIADEAITENKGIANGAITENKGIANGAITENKGIANTELNQKQKESLHSVQQEDPQVFNLLLH